MEKWQWNSRLETGIKVIDEQHKGLFKRIDQLEIAIYKGTAAEELKKIIEYLNSYIIEHLEAEEKILRDNNYIDYAKHKKQHDEFRTLCEHIIAQYNESGPDSYLAIDVDKQMRKWWEDHILKMDMAYVPYIKKEVDFL